MSVMGQIYSTRDSIPTQGTCPRQAPPIL